jgi:hypothetical protein
VNVTAVSTRLAPTRAVPTAIRSAAAQISGHSSANGVTPSAIAGTNVNSATRPATSAMPTMAAGTRPSSMSAGRVRHSAKPCTSIPTPLPNSRMRQPYAA